MDLGHWTYLSRLAGGRVDNYDLQAYRVCRDDFMAYLYLGRVTLLPVDGIERICINIKHGHSPRGARGGFIMCSQPTPLVSCGLSLERSCLAGGRRMRPPACDHSSPRQMDVDAGPRATLKQPQGSEHAVTVERSGLAFHVPDAATPRERPRARHDSSPVLTSSL